MNLTALINFLFITAIVSVAPLHSQSYKINSFEQEENLSHAFIYAVNQDSKGYLWLGTADGLYRYNGFKFDYFTTNDSLAENFVTTIYNAGKNTWFGHMNGLITKFDGDKFRVLTMQANNNSSITSICESDNSNLWVSYYANLLVSIDKKLGQKSYKFTNPEETILSFADLGNNRVIIGSIDGLKYCMLKESGEISVIEHFSEIPHAKIESIILKNDNSGYYIATTNEGVYSLSAEANRFKIARIDDPLDSLAFGIQTIFEDSRSDIWLGTFGNGIIKLDLNSDRSGYKSIVLTDKKFSAQENFKVVFEDRDENIWAGTYGSGLRKITAQTYSDETLDVGKYGSNYIAISNTQKFRWIGTEKGLVQQDVGTNRVVNFFTPGSGLPDDILTSIYTKSEQEIWIGTRQSGLFQLNPGKGIVEQISMGEGILENSVTCVTGFNNTLWVGTKKGACEINLETSKQQWYTINKGGLPHNSVNYIYISSDTSVWISTLSNTIVAVHDSTVTKRTINLSSGVISLKAITSDNQGNLWVGSSGGGLFLVTPDSVLNFTTGEGLFSDYCYSIICDKNDFVWVGHRGGISRIHTKTFSIKTIQSYAGIKDNYDFNINALSIDYLGKLWFGYNQGFLSYSPDLENTIFREPVLSFTKIKVNDAESDFNEKINLSPGKYKLEFEFIGINLKEPDKVKYQYRLTGYDKDWSNITKSNTVEYYQVHEGTYIFEVNASSGDGIMTSESLKIELFIRKPVWKQAWFYLLVFIVVFTMVFVFIKTREQRHKTEKKVLEHKVQERTLEIQRQKEEIEEQRDLIKRKNKDITDSLKYARKIQSAIMPPDELLSRLLPDHFLIYMPKDIVSGDFCWYTKKDNKIAITVVDCTGHGVPGAIMSMLGITSLNDIVVNQGITTPSRILELLRLKVISSLSQHSKNSPSFDGMNLGLCVIDQETLKVQFSGAMNNLIYIQDDKIKVLRADRIPIGISYLEDQPFTNFEIQGKAGDIFYLFSDGYQDQFGGDSDKKFSSKRLYELLEDIMDLPLNRQKEKLVQVLSGWMSGYEQTDDITVLGFRI